MLYIVLSAIIIVPVLLGIGGLFEKILGRIWEGTSGTLAFGMMGISLTWTILAFWFPINLPVESITILIGASAFFYFRKHLRLIEFLQENRIIFPIFLAVILFFAGYFPFIIDHFGYYVPTIKWISEIGLVKGISNLDFLLGQSSIWHIFQAGFSNFADPFLRINAIVLIVYLIYIIERKNWIHLLFFPFLFLFVQSPSPDLPIMAFSMILLNEIFTRTINPALAFAFSVFLLAIKPTLIWLPIFTFGYFLLIEKKNLQFIFGGLIILILFFAKNIWTFGFPVFPVQAIDVGILWKPNQQLLRISSEVAISKTFNMQYSLEEINNFSFFEFAQNWLTLDGMKSVIHSSFIISLLIFTVFTFIKKKKIMTILLVSVLIKSVLVLAFSAQYRFFSDVFLVIIFILFYEIIQKKQALILFAAMSIVVGIFLSFPKLIQDNVSSFRLAHMMMGFRTSQFLKPSYFELKKYKTYEIGNLKFNVVDDYPFTFDTPIPAISPAYIQQYLDAGIIPQKIGKELKDGFIWRKASKAELQQMEQILKNHK